VPGGFIDDACARREGFWKIMILTSLPVLVVPLLMDSDCCWVMVNLSLLDKMASIIISGYNLFNSRLLSVSGIAVDLEVKLENRCKTW
jgi:hypothetical protein